MNKTFRCWRPVAAATAFGALLLSAGCSKLPGVLKCNWTSPQPEQPGSDSVSLDNPSVAPLPAPLPLVEAGK
jgi:hypothetical protein